MATAVSEKINDITPDSAEFKKGFAKWLPMIVLSLALMIIVIDTTILNVSLRPIVNDLHTNLQGVQWVITGYALTLGALTITGGRLGDLFGRKKMFVIGAVIFAIGSFVTSISPNIGVMVIGEAIIEGIGAALMMPATASLLVANYKGRDRAIAFGIWGGIAAASAAIGPIVGGFLTTNFSWRWAFRVNVFVAIILVLGSLVISESHDRTEKKELDFVGVILSAVGLLVFVYGVINSSTYGWWLAKQHFAFFGHSVEPFGLAVAPLAMILGLVILGIFVWWQRRIEAAGHTPLVSTHLFANKQFTSGASVMALLSFGMIGLIFTIPVFLQSARNLDAFHTGLALLPMSIAMLIVAPGSAFFSKHITPKRLIQAGLVLAMLASVVLHFSIHADSTAMSFAPGLLLFGAGMGLVMAQTSNLTLSAVPVDQAGEASGVNNTLRQVGSSFGSAIIGAVLLTTLASSLATGIKTSDVIPSNLKPALASSIASQASNVELSGTGQNTQAQALPKDAQAELVSIAQEASAQGSRTAILYTGAFIFFGFLASFALPNVKDLESHARGDTAPAAH